MNSYKVILQRILSIVLFFGVVAVLFVLGVIFLWYFLLLGVALVLGRMLYVFFTKKKAAKPQSSDVPFESGHVEVGHFSKGPGRIIEHHDDI